METLDSNPTAAVAEPMLASFDERITAARNIAAEARERIAEVRNELLVHFTAERDGVIRHVNAELARVDQALAQLDVGAAVRQLDDVKGHCDFLLQAFERVAYGLFWLC